MHCLFIPFLATIVPVREAVRNHQFLQHAFSEGSKSHHRGQMAVPFSPPAAKMETFALCGFQLYPEVMHSWVLPTPSGDLLSGNTET